MRRVLLFLGVFISLNPSRSAAACGGCFHSEPPAVTGTGTGTGGKSVQVITDHRMVFSLSLTRTTLWDQIRYSGEPGDFIWVLPVPHAQPLDIGLGDNAFVDAVDQISAPALEAQATQTCFSNGTSSVSSTNPYGSSSGGGGGGGGGCGGGAPGIDYSPGSRGGGSDPYPGRDASATGGDDYRGSESVRVGAMGVAVVGPYAVERVSGAPGDEGFASWAARNHYGIPTETQATVRYYAELSSDFLVLRLRPEAGVQQMQPVRIRFPGYHPTLPLRMVAAGVADTVGLTLLVIAAGPVEARNFENVEIPTDGLVWNFSTNSSNYRAAFESALRTATGNAWVIESLQHVTPPMMRMDPASHDAGVDDVFGTVGTSTGATDGGAMDGGPALDRSDPYVDRRIAFDGLSGTPMLTRMRTVLRRAQLATDLQLDASERAPIPPQRTITRFVFPPCPPAQPVPSSYPDAGTPGAPSSYTPLKCGLCAASQRRASWGRLTGPGGLALAGVALVLRRRRRRGGTDIAK